MDTFSLIMCFFGCAQEMMRTEKNSVVESGKKFFNENSSSGQYSYPEWNKAVIPSVSRTFPKI